MKKILIALFVLAAAVVACNSNDNPSPALTSSSASGLTPGQSNCTETYDLIAGQTIDVGSVSITNDDDSIYVTYTIENGWTMTEYHLYVGDSANCPVNAAGNPVIGQFPYSNDTLNNVTTYTIAIAIDPNLDCYFVAAHAVVHNGNQTETAWLDGDQFVQQGSWAMYNSYCLQDCCEFPTSTYDYYAGQHINIGSLEVTNDDDSLYITYDLTGNWMLNQTHVYVGPLSGLPVNKQGNPINGHFPYQTTHDPNVSSFTYAIALSGLDDCFIVAAHSEVNLYDDDGSIIQSETGWSFGTPFCDKCRWGWYSEYCVGECE